MVELWLKLENDMTTAVLSTSPHDYIKSHFKDGGFAARANI